MAPATLCAVQGDDYPGDVGPCGPDNLLHLAYGGAGGNDVINDQHTALQRCAYRISAFPVGLGFLAVEGVGHINAVLLGEGRGGYRGQGNSLVGGSENQIELNAGIDNRARVMTPKRGQSGARIEASGIEEVRAGATGLECELAETKHATIQGEFQKFTLVRLHSNRWMSRGIGLRYDTRTSWYEGDMRVISLNANGIRAAARKGFFDWLDKQSADVVCIQETKAQEHQLSDEVFRPGGFHCYYHDAEKKGYSGVAIYARQKPDRVIRGLGRADRGVKDWQEFDREGRYIEARFGGLSVVSLYLPSGSSSEERQAAKFRFLDLFMPYLMRLRRRRREYVLCGDWNIAHKPIDLKNWRANQKNSGFLPEERAWMDNLFGRAKYVDTFRRVNQEPEQYTWWSNRGRAWDNNVGWRIDYQVATPEIGGRVLGTSIYKDDRFSDHAPLIMDYAGGA